MRSENATLPPERRRLIAEELRERGSVSIAKLERDYGISQVTARRDLVELERLGMARRTYGGAVLPASSNFQDSFSQRLDVAAEAKERLAKVAVDEVSEDQAIFIDNSTTGYFVARHILRRNLRCTVLTNSAAILDLVYRSDASQVDLIAIGGTLRRITGSFVGPEAIRAIESHLADQVLFSVRGLTADGDLTDPNSFEAEIKRAMIRRSRRAVLLIDASKFDQIALSVIAPVTEVGLVLAADPPRQRLQDLIAAGVNAVAV